MADSRVARPPSTAALPSVYVDTSVPSYLTRRRARAAPVARNQLITCLWWNAHRARFCLFVSARVFAEASRGNREEVQRRMEALAHVPLLNFENEAVKWLADDRCLFARLRETPADSRIGT